MHAVKYECKDQDQDNSAPPSGDESDDQATGTLETNPVNDHMGIESGNVSDDKNPDEALAAVIDDTWESLFENF